jgi:hypothetical protein
MIDDEVNDPAIVAIFRLPEEERRRRKWREDAEAEYTQMEQAALDVLRPRAEELRRDARTIARQLGQPDWVDEDFYMKRVMPKWRKRDGIATPEDERRHQIYLLYCRYEKIRRRLDAIESHAWARTNCLLTPETGQYRSASAAQAA